jgi:geranylgeranyl diphosphate synthase type II
MIHPLEVQLKTVIDEAGFTPRLQAAVLHSQLPPGKMIRGVIALSLCDDLGGDSEKLLPAAAAIELLHTSSLIHDDLPAMDDDDMRRGRASCHKAFDEATAVLAGDALVSLSHRLLCEIDYDAHSQIKFVSSLSGAYFKLCNGQQLDLLGAKDKETLENIHRLKTAALFATAMEFGALGAAASDPVLKAASRAGEIIGLTFQVVDDYLDNFASEKGRSAGSDKKNDKMTFDGLKTSESALSYLNAEMSKLTAALSDLASLAKLKSTSPEVAFPKTYPVIRSVWEKVNVLNKS